MDVDQLKFILEELSFSATLPPEVLDRLAAESTIQELKSGTVLFREGSLNNNLYLIRTGRLALEMNVPGRGAVRILTLGPGEMVGWSSLLDKGKMTAAAIAAEDTEIVCAPSNKLKELCEASREFGYHLMLQMAFSLSKRLIATRLQMLDLFADAPPVTPTSKADGEA